MTSRLLQGSTQVIRDSDSINDALLVYGINTTGLIFIKNRNHPSIALKRYGFCYIHKVYRLSPWKKIFFNFIHSRMISLNVNQKDYKVDVNPDMPLLWVLRDFIGLTGTKYGCGVAQCGACVVHLDGEAVRSCITKVSRVEQKKIVTIEGLSVNNDHPLQLAWDEIGVPQCGYCHSGQLMSAAVLLRENPHPTDDDIDDAMAGNICRCGTYLRIRKGIHLAAELQRKGSSKG